LKAKAATQPDPAWAKSPYGDGELSWKLEVRNIVGESDVGDAAETEIPIRVLTLVPDRRHKRKTPPLH
jgi:hypothetical protein